jgi:hypothetical protein
MNQLHIFKYLREESSGPVNQSIPRLRATHNLAGEGGPLGLKPLVTDGVSVRDA